MLMSGTFNGSFGRTLAMVAMVVSRATRGVGTAVSLSVSWLVVGGEVFELLNLAVAAAALWAVIEAIGPASRLGVLGVLGVPGCLGETGVLEQLLSP
mmetsp:Transcript_72698/g.184047  ORF Transcript_72698/g.184047 Transcript_72698/m.184047 type:complete len:97 (+) Transcript_72698:482-772(+)